MIVGLEFAWDSRHIINYTFENKHFVDFVSHLKFQPAYWFIGIGGEVRFGIFQIQK